MERGSTFITRRSLLKIGVSAGSLVVTSGWGLAALCPSVSTPRQTRGPFFPYDDVVAYPIREQSENTISLVEANDNDLTRVKGKAETAKGQVVYFQGELVHRPSQEVSKVEACTPIVGATVLLWQANFSGQYNHRLDESAHRNFPHPKTGKMIERVHDEYFQYWGKAVSDERGKFHFKTILPGFYPAEEDWYRPPHLHFSIRATGYPEFVTQTYFKGDALPNIDLIHELNAKDFILRSPRIPSDQQERVIVEYGKDHTGKLYDGLVGKCRFLLPY